MFSVDIATLFPQMCECVLNCSIIGRARKSGLVDIQVYDIRDFSVDKHKKVDDYPYGGGAGMLIQAEPVFRCYEHVLNSRKNMLYVIYLSPQGKVLTQKDVLKFSFVEVPIFLLCGHYEGIDQRVIDEIVDEEVSIGDYVMTGGELAALVFIDSVVRLLPGVLSSRDSYVDESHFNGLLEYPQYTRPNVWHGVEVPEVLISGHHKNIENWRVKKALEVTRKKRPDLLND